MPIPPRRPTLDTRHPTPDTPMPYLIENPTVIESAGNMPKRIEEFAGQVNSGHQSVSVAKMTSPPGWKNQGKHLNLKKLQSY